MERGQFQAWAEKQTWGPILWKIQNKDKGRISCLKTPYLKLWGLKSKAASLCHRLLPRACKQQRNVPFSLMGFQTATFRTVCDFILFIYFKFGHATRLVGS